MLCALVIRMNRMHIIITLTSQQHAERGNVIHSILLSIITSAIYLCSKLNMKKAVGKVKV